MRRAIVALMSTVSLVACVTVEDGPVPPKPGGAGAPAGARAGVGAGAETAAMPAITDPDGFDLSALEPKRLADGECGIFLFTSNPSPRFVFFSNDTRGYAEMIINGAPVTLQRVSTGGSAFAQSFTEQDFRDGARGIDVALALNPGAPMDGGYEIASGAMRMTRSDGWSMVIPVSGAAACQADASSARG